MAEQKILTKNQIRAQKAYERVFSEVAGADVKYPPLAKSFPALVHNCGLAQAVAFVVAKSGTTGTRFLGHLSAVMPLDTSGEKGDLQKQSREAHLLEYQQLTRDVIESATWIKRYAEALLKGD